MMASITIWIGSFLVILLACLPALMVLKNLTLFRTATSDPKWLNEALKQTVRVVIPARNEEATIERSLQTLVASHFPNWEAVVVDDASEDSTPQLVDRITQHFPQIRRIEAGKLPEGWNGKQHACWRGAQGATTDYLLFLDADVRMTPDAMQRILAQQLATQAPLLSGFPKQEMGTWAEQWMIPMMHFLLLGYLPIDRMRAGTDPAFSAGCGQLFCSRRDAYEQTGGHSAIRGSRHDGIQLPKTYRKAKLATDFFDASDLAVCRMYQNTQQVRTGLLKNATEGIARMPQLAIFTVFLLAASIGPWILLAIAWLRQWPIGLQALLLLAGLATWIPRFMIAKRLQQPFSGVLAHPISLLWFLLLQWKAFLMARTGKSIAWRGRSS
jgi:glycosyltransferase involved in cell wall biosynthesis